MFPLITAAELLARDFVLAEDTRCEFPSKHKKKSSSLLLRFAMTYIQIKISLLLLRLFFPSLNVLSCQTSAVILIPFSAFGPPSQALPTEWKRIYMRAKDCRGSRHSPRSMTARCLHVGLLSCKSPADLFPDCLAEPEAFKPTGQSTSDRKVLTQVQAPRLSQKNVRTN